MMITIREANPEDFPRALEMGRHFYETTSYPSVAPYDHQSVVKIAECLRDAGILLVAEADGELIGMVGLVFAPFMFNQAIRTAHEVMWWVDPEHRETGAGVALMRAVEPACRAHGISGIQMGTLSNSPPQAAALYRRLGFEHTETVFFKDISP